MPGTWRAVVTADGSPTLVDPRTGEACHAREGAWLEARERYAAPCRLRERALAGADELALLDVGTGLGLNLAAALAALAGTSCRLRATTLELERGVIERALELPAGGPDAPWAEPWRVVRAALAACLAGAPRATLGRRGTLELRLGDARATLAALDPGRAFDAVFLDPFSPRVAPELWTAELLDEVARRTRPGAILSTYSASLAVRATLRASGLAVGRGPRAAGKAEGTLAARDAAVPPLAARTARKLERRVERLR